jgi:uracil-DNA glycosylase
MEPIRYVKIEASWKNKLETEFSSSYFAELKLFLLSERLEQTVYPPGNQIFSAFSHTPFDAVKVVIVGQDPYHGPGQANGLCFSVAPGLKLPPSLQNIYKEIESDIGLPMSKNGDLRSWANQGVFLLNTTLTVREGSPASHHGKGWERFTDAAIKALSNERDGLVFLLWGKPAQSKEKLIDATKHFILKAAHPSPLSAYNGFFGCRHFSKANKILLDLGKTPIHWQV